MLVIASASYILLLPAPIGALFLHIPVMKCARLAAGLIAMDFILLLLLLSAVLLYPSPHLALPCDRSSYSLAFLGVGTLFTYIAVVQCARACRWIPGN